MSRLPETLRQSRALRDAAWALVRQDADFLKADLARRGIGRRVADRALLAARDGVSGARALARENSGLVAGGVIAVISWLILKPVFGRIRRWFCCDAAPDDARTNDNTSPDSATAQADKSTQEQRT